MGNAGRLGRWGIVGALALAGCGRRPAGDAVAGDTAGTARPSVPAAAPGPVAIGSAGDSVRLAAPARRVISLIPAVTDLVVALGAADRVVGRTRYDVDPRVAGATDVGGGLDPSLEALVALRPDLVIAWGRDRRGAVPQQLAASGIPTLVLAVDDSADVFAALEAVAALLDRRPAGATLADSLRRTWRAVAASVAGRPRPRVLHVVSVDPPMSAGPRTFIGQLIAVAGGENVVTDSATAWPTLSLETLVAHPPDVLVSGTRQSREALLADLRARPGWRALPAVRTGRVVVLDPDLVERPGPRMGEAARVLRDALHGPRP